MSNTKKNNNNNYLSAKPTFDHQVKGMEGFFFYYGKGMHAQASKTWPHAEGQMVNSKQFSADCMESINCGEITIIRMKEPQEYTNEAFNALSLKKQKMWDLSLKRWLAIEEAVGEEACRAYTFIWMLCHTSLKFQIELDPEYIKMRNDPDPCKRQHPWVLKSVIQRLTTGAVLVENPQQTFLGMLYNLLFIKGDDYENLHDYFEAFRERFKVAEECGLNFGNERLRDLYIADDEAREDSMALTQKLEVWKNLDKAGPKAAADDEKQRQETMKEAKMSLHYSLCCVLAVHRSGETYVQYRVTLSNDFTNSNNNYASTLAMQQKHMQYWRQLFTQFAATPNNNTGGTQHLQLQNGGGKQGGKGGGGNGGGGKSKTGGDQHLVEGGGGGQPDRTCLKCDRVNECTATTCTHTTKADGSPVNSKDEIDKRVLEMKITSIKRRHNNKSTDGVQHFLDSDILPSFMDVVSEESPYEEDVESGFAFVQDDLVIIEDVTGHNDHIYNQSSINLADTDILCDSQSTSDVIVNLKFLNNIRPCRWTLSLRTQLGRCEINQIGGMPGVGIVWYYPEGAANILSEFRMITRSSWDIEYSTKKFRVTGNPADLAKEYTTKEQRMVRFLPTVQGLHVMDCSKFFEKGLSKDIFGRGIFDNKTEGGNAMAHALYDHQKLNNSDGIDTIAKSRDRFCS